MQPAEGFVLQLHQHVCSLLEAREAAAAKTKADLKAAARARAEHVPCTVS